MTDAPPSGSKEGTRRDDQPDVVGPKKAPTEGSGSRAPLVVFAGMVGIGVVAVAIVLINHCQREEPYLDPQEIERGTPDRVPPPPPEPR